MKKLSYLIPQADWSDSYMLQDLICDSYSSGIDDFTYEDVDWTATP